MKIYNKQEAAERINRLAAAGEDFVFAISYDMNQAYVERVADINPEECMFNFRGTTNAPVDKKIEGKIEWGIDAPTLKEYAEGFNYVAEELREHRIDLINYTSKCGIRTNLSLRDIFLTSTAMYRLWIKDKLVCFSPEIFIRIENGEISSYPMKGTISADIPEAAKIIIDDPKEADEHEKVVALIREDLSKVSEEVWVERFRYIDRLETNKGPILETSSEVRGKLPSDYREHIGDIIFAQLPAGSITGAPKDYVMDVIEASENYDRGFYTGIMGLYHDGMLDSSVMIRFLDKEDGKLYYKAGGGVTRNSKLEREYKEMIQKVYVPSN